MAQHVVTGAFGYIGRRVARLLLERGEEVRTITTHPQKPNPFGERVRAFPYHFDRPERLISHLQGAAALYNTYWVRFEYGDLTFEQALRNTRTLFECARRAGVKRAVHVSVTQAELNDPLPYYDGKAKQEQLLRSSGLSYAIVRPTLVFGRGDILVNNIAWLLRRFPVFPLFGSGEYRLQPIYIGDLARRCVELAASTENVTEDVVGPEGYTFEALVRLMAQQLGEPARLIHVPPALALAAGRLIGLMVGDVLLTPDEVRGLMRGKLTSEQEPRGEVRFSSWLREHASELGRGYESELARHFNWSPSD